MAPYSLNYSITNSTSPRVRKAPYHRGKFSGNSSLGPSDNPKAPTYDRSTSDGKCTQVFADMRNHAIFEFFEFGELEPLPPIPFNQMA